MEAGTYQAGPSLLDHVLDDWLTDASLIQSIKLAHSDTNERSSSSMNDMTRNDQVSPSLVSSTTPSMSHSMSSSPLSFTGYHPLSVPKHVCAICGDRASGKHYGVYSCEGCKGFFKRTVRKDLTYTCRDTRRCVVDKRQRNRCQYCRYNKCLTMGMRTEAVQEERHRNRGEKGDGEPESTSQLTADMPPDAIHDAELTALNSISNMQLNTRGDAIDCIASVEAQLQQLVEWARMVPHFATLPLRDQAILLHTSWHELILVQVAYRSRDQLLRLWPGQTINRNQAHSMQLGQLFDRIMTELTNKLHAYGADTTELGCLKTIVLYNPDIAGLKSSAVVDGLREKVYACLEEYCKQLHPEPGRFAKLLLRLPSLRSIAMHSVDSLNVNVVPPVPSMSCFLAYLAPVQSSSPTSYLN